MFIILIMYIYYVILINIMLSEYIFTLYNIEITFIYFDSH